MNLDYSVYPDVPNPTDLPDKYSKADYVFRICRAWDFGIVPTEETIDLFAGWKNIFCEFPIYNSMSYIAFIDYFGWELDRSIRADCLEYLEIQDDWQVIDRRNGRPFPDPCFATT